MVINKKTLFLLVFKVENSQIKALPDAVPYKGSISVISGCFWLCLHIVEGMNEFPGVS